FRIARVVVAVEADAVGDRGPDRLGRAAPQPLVVVEVRIAGRTGCARTVALDAVDLERGGAGRRGELAQRVVGKDLLDRSGSNGGDIVGLGGLGCGKLLLDVAAARPADH